MTRLSKDEIAAAFGPSLRRAIETALQSADAQMRAAEVDQPARDAILVTALAYLMADQIRSRVPQEHRFHVLGRTIEIATLALMTDAAAPERSPLQ